MNSSFGQFDDLDFLDAYSEDLTSSANIPGISGSRALSSTGLSKTKSSLSQTGKTGKPGSEPDEYSDTLCENCLEEMYSAGLYLLCDNCGATRPLPENESRAGSSCTVVIGAGRGRKIYNVPTRDSQGQRRAALKKDLENLYLHAPSHLQISKEILMTAADYYSDLQNNKKDTIIDSETGEAIGEAPWVHRGEVMKEILGAMIYFLAHQNGVIKSKKEVSALLDLSTDGFSRGEDKVRRLISAGELPGIRVDTEDARSYAFAYLQGLGLSEAWQLEFVVEVVEFAFMNNWGLNCKLSSKVAGAVWMLVSGAVEKIGRRISCAEVERATGGIKKTTLVKLSKTVVDNSERFKYIFDKYEVFLPDQIPKPARAAGRGADRIITPQAGLIVVGQATRGRPRGTTKKI